MNKLSTIIDKYRYLLIFEHADGLHGLHWMRVLDDAVAARLPVPILIDLGPDDAPGKPKNFSKFLIVH